MTQHKKSQSIGLLMTIIFSVVLLGALAVVLWPVPVVYAADPPDAVDDTATTSEDIPVAISVLANDLGYTLTVDTVGIPDNGIASTNGVTVTYTPTLNFSGLDVFTYTIRDTDSLTDTATVTVTVTPVNDPPVADNDTYNVNEGITLTVTAPGVLDGDTDVENDTLTATLASPPSHGTLDLNPDGSFTYVHDGTTDSDHFTYRAYDGNDLSNVATATINIQLFPPEITAITVTSDSPTYFYAPPLGDLGGEVFFNSVFGEGGGQTITVTVWWTDANPYSLAGDTAFGYSPSPDISGPPWTLTYPIGLGANSQPNRVFTVTDKAGLTDTAVITFTQDNVDPTVELTDVTDPGYDYDPDWGQPTNELDTDGSNWYNTGDFILSGVTYRWYFTSTTSDGGAGLASGSAFWDHSSGTTYDQTKNCGSDGSDFFSGFGDDPDGVVIATVTITDRVGNSASNSVVFNVDNTPPTISSPFIDEYNSPYLHVLGSTVIFYGYGMGSTPQPFRVQGQSTDGTGVGLDRAEFSGAFGNPPPFDDTTPITWTAHYYPDGQDWDDGTIQVTVSDLLGNSDTELFVYYRDVDHPTVWLTDVTDPDYDDGDELNGTGNWYRTSGLTSGWAFTSTTGDIIGGAGLGSGTALWDHSSGTTYDQTTNCGPGGDGTFTGVSDDGDGTVSVTVTITDNVSNATSAMLVIRLDDTAPSVPGSFHYLNDDTDEGGDGFLPEAGYYDAPVINLEWDPSTDDGSGLLTPPYHLGTAPQPTGGPYPEDSPYTVSGSGTYSIYLTAEDNAGNISDDEVTGPVVVDLEHPQAVVDCPPSTTEESFTVNWSATADPGPAGLRSTDPYSVSYKVDAGEWQDWLISTSAVTATFGPDSPVTVEYGHTYCFRLRAVDKAGNVTYTNGDDCTVALDPGLQKVFLPVLMVPDPNWDFETGDFTSWDHGGQLAQSVSTAEHLCGNYSALLGSPSYVCQGGVPVGSAWMSRWVEVPSSGSPTLSFYYRIFTQDKTAPEYLEVSGLGEIVPSGDRFAVEINGEQLFTDANTTLEEGCGTPYDLGWKQGVLSLNAYKGQIIVITFHNYNWPDEWFNTYTYVDCVSVQ